ncbi:MAG: diphthine--ammonia ligase [Candidatus Woesearchaeota archaeon]
MCGIIGSFPQRDVSEAISCLVARGRDYQATKEVSGGVFAHVLHATTGNTHQPVVGEGVLLFNGQIYNYEFLAQQEGLSVTSDTQVLLYLLDTYSVDEVLARLDGVFAFAYLRDGVLVLARDVLGVKPLWYSTQGGLLFASEKKALIALGVSARELHPRCVLRYDVKKGSLTSQVRELQFRQTSLSLDEALVAAVRKRIPQSNRVAVLFSGGVDSSLVALLAKQAGAEVTLYVAALDDPQKQDPHDLLAATKAASLLDLPLVQVRASLEDVESVVGEVCSLIEDSSVVKVGVALPFWFACQAAFRDGHRVIFSGLGAEEVFGGYQRHKQALDVNAECLRGLRAMHERDLYRDDVVCMRHSLELRLPFLDHEVVSCGLAISGEEKIVGGLGKVALRHAASRLGLPEEIAFLPKKAAQYGSQFDAALEKLARRKGFSKSEFLREAYPVNARLCTLLSSGKDSVYATYLMQQMNYEVVCAATIVSDNSESYMYHTPAIRFASLQAESMGLAHLVERTSGVKEEEVDALRAVLVRAIDEFDIQGVVSGALFSEYQRSRIEVVCEELGLQVFAPLWHIDQELEVREILDAGFSFVFSKVAAEGLDRGWVGREITHEDVDVLTSKLGLNVAGEGGEYESLVLDGPNFSFPLSLDGFEVVCESEGSVEVCELVENK